MSQNAESLSKYEIIGGHFPLYHPRIKELEDFVGKENVIYLGAIRNPVDQLISHFNYIKKIKSHPLYFEGSLMEALKSKSKFFDVSKNIQTGYFAKSQKFEDAIKVISDKKCIISAFPNIDQFFQEIFKLLNMDQIGVPLTNIGEKEISREYIECSVEYCNEYSKEDLALFNFLKERGVWKNIS